MNMRIAAAVSALILSSASAFVRLAPFHHSTNLLDTGGARQRLHSPLAAVKSPPAFPTPKVTSKTPIPNDSAKMKNIMEARGSLLEIETSAEKARAHLDYLEQVASVIRSYLSDTSVIPYQPNLDVPNLTNVEEAQEYLENIEKATESAHDYLDYLEGMAQGIKAYLKKFENQYKAGAVTATNAKQAQEAKIYMSDLEETSAAAHTYLGYLKKVTSVVQEYLVDPNLQGVQDLLKVSPPPGLKSMQELLEPSPTAKPTKSLHARATRVIPKPAVQPDNPHAPRPTRRIPGVPISEVRGATTSKRAKSNDKTSTVNAEKTVTTTAGSPATVKATTTSVETPTASEKTSTPPPMTMASAPKTTNNASYLDSINRASSSTVTGGGGAASGGSYLDSIATKTTPPNRANGVLETTPSKPEKTLKTRAVPDVDQRDFNAAKGGEMQKTTAKTAKVRVVPCATPDPVDRSELKRKKKKKEPAATPAVAAVAKESAKPMGMLDTQPQGAAAGATKGTLRFFMSRVAPHLQDPNSLPG